MTFQMQNDIFDGVKIRTTLPHSFPLRAWWFNSLVRSSKGLAAMITYTC